MVISFERMNIVGCVLTQRMYNFLSNNGKVRVIDAGKYVFHASLDDYKTWPYVVIYTEGPIITGVEWP
jgi:hypothetical protein